MFTPVLDSLIILTVLAPLVGVAAQRIKAVKFLGAYTSVGFLFAILNLYWLYGEVHASKVLVFRLTALPGSCLVVDMLSIFMGLVFLLLGLMASIFSIRYMEHDTGLPEYFTLVLAMITGMVGTVFAGDFFTLFLFWELMCISSYVLVAFRKQTWEPVEAGFKYLIMSVSGSVLILMAIALLYGMTGTVNLAVLSGRLGGVELTPAAERWVYFALVLVITGFGIKASIVPLHTWLPDAHPAAPTPISALLSGVVIKTGVYALCRISFLIFPLIHFHWGILIGVISVLTMTVGNIMALLQNDIKRILAYSSISQIGYILIGVAVGTQLGLTGAILHVFNHALMKGAAFLCAGAFIHAVGTRMLDELSGIGRRMPLSTIALCITFFGLIGIPPLSGFISKLILFEAASAGMVWLTIAGIINTAISTGYYLRFINIIIRHESSERVTVAKEAPVTMLAPIFIMALLIILFGIWVQPILGFAQEAAASLLNLKAYISAVGGGL